MQFFEGEGDTGGGEAPSIASILGEPGGETAASPPADATVPVPPSTAVDLDALASKFGDAISKNFPKVPAQSESKLPALTPEEARKLLNVWEPGDDFVAKFGNIETQKAAFAELRDNLIRQADTIAQARMQQMQQAWEQRFNPVQGLIEQQTAQAREGRFADSYPQLAQPNLRPLLAQVAGDLHRSGKFSGDEVANFKLLADGVAAVVKSINPSFSLEAKMASAIKPKTTSNGIPITTPGAGGGGGNAPVGEASGKTPKLIGLLGKVP